MKFLILDFGFWIDLSGNRKSKIENRKSPHGDAIVREFHPLTLLRPLTYQRLDEHICLTKI